MTPETLDKLHRICNALQSVAAEIRRQTDETVVSNDPIAIVKHYNDLRIVNETIKESREALSDIGDLLSRVSIPEVFASHDVKTITVEGVGRVTVSYRFSCSMLNKEKGFEWLRDTGNESLIVETVNAQTLSSFARVQMEDMGVELPSEIFKTSSMPFTSITKVK